MIFALIAICSCIPVYGDLPADVAERLAKMGANAAAGAREFAPIHQQSFHNVQSIFRLPNPAGASNSAPVNSIHNFGHHNAPPPSLDQLVHSSSNTQVLGGTPFNLFQNGENLVLPGNTQMLGGTHSTAGDRPGHLGPVELYPKFLGPPPATLPNMQPLKAVDPEKMHNEVAEVHRWFSSGDKNHLPSIGPSDNYFDFPESAVADDIIPLNQPPHKRQRMN